MSYTTVDGYIAAQPAEFIAMLEQLRSIIRSVVPQAEEVLSYMIPNYKYHGMLVGFGARKEGCSFYTMDPKLLNGYKDELKDLRYSGSTIHFDPGKKLPVALIKKIIKHRMRDNEERALLKKQSKLK